MHQESPDWDGIGTKQYTNQTSTCTQSDGAGRGSPGRRDAQLFIQITFKMTKTIR